MTGEHRWVDITTLQQAPFERHFVCACGESRMTSDPHGNPPEPDDEPAVPPSSAVQGQSRTDGPPEVSGPQNGAEHEEEVPDGRLYVKETE